jgi:hypothetical protein
LNLFHIPPWRNRSQRSACHHATDRDPCRRNYPPPRRPVAHRFPMPRIDHFCSPEVSR